MREGEASVIGVLIVDDQELIRAGLRAVVESDPGLRVVGEAGDGAAAVAVARRTRPDVVLLDVQMPGTDGLRGLAELLEQCPRARVVMLTMYDLDDYVVTALAAGASGFLLKTAPPTEILEAIHAVHEGRQVFATSVMSRLVETFVARGPVPVGVPEPLADLSCRELDVVRGLARGLSNREIGELLHLSETTVKTYISRILGKLGLRDRVQLVIVALQSGLDLTVPREACTPGRPSAVSES